MTSSDHESELELSGPATTRTAPFSMAAGTAESTISLKGC